ncbi:Ig-like domain-containing protein [uncultured Sulfitobacter sp.]|uniref:Ig-like domain-containing protein n=1 Tax=uncultured Sulfitobacter sp. TaxID=191468 RepID=UPI002616CC43|nr:Ig-like domain-containing protein [uncultured Sulfitobacter sp.]
MHHSVTDEALQHGFGVFELKIVSVEDKPIAGDDVAAGVEDTPLVITPLGNDTDPYGGLVRRIHAVDPVDTTTVTVAPYGQSETLTPNPEYHGQTTLNYNSVDDIRARGRGKIEVTIATVNDPPEVPVSRVFGFDTTEKFVLMATDKAGAQESALITVE